MEKNLLELSDSQYLLDHTLLIDNIFISEEFI